MKFTLEIELGNDSMQTYEDVLAAITTSLQRNSGGGMDDKLLGGYSSPLRDLNGNTVGKWQVAE